MTRHILRNSMIAFALLAGIVMPARSDINSLVRKLPMDKLELEVRVQDAHQHALKGASIWYVDNPLGPSRPVALDTIILSRMAKRYAHLTDFLDTNDLPGAVFEKTDLRGVYRNFRELSRVSGKPHHYILVATKRGYLPQVSEGAAPLNRRHTVTLTLEADPDFTGHARMEEFDQLMAEALSPLPDEDIVGKTRMRN